MSHEDAIVQQMQSAVTAYMRAECPYREAQSAISVRLQDFVDAVAEDVRDEHGDIPGERRGSEESRRRRQVYVELIVGAERRAKLEGRSLSNAEIEKLLRLMCWLCDSANAMGRRRFRPAVSEAEAA